MPLDFIVGLIVIAYRVTMIGGASYLLIKRLRSNAKAEELSGMGQKYL
jgi:hypothetical protein